ncbi:MAG: GIY-YIG nuclease family protein [Bacteroidales bacterium]|nr:GIY-YIG nuclease family protein [Bacteroidales bacterium]
MERGGYVYILTNKSNRVLYTGVTSNLYSRTVEHKNKIHPRSFTARYNVNKLVYYEFLLTIEEAIKREKQIKGGSRKKKLELINSKNPKWLDLFNELEPE